MKKTPPSVRSVAAIFCLIGFAVAHGEETTVKSSFTPGAVTLGQQATYTVSISGDKQPSGFNLPSVDGLSFQYLGPNRSVQSTIINGRFETAVTVSYNFRTDAARFGEFVLPAFRVAVGGREFTVPAARISVLPPDGKEAVTMDEVAFLTLTCVEGPIYVGQTAVCAINLHIHAALTDARYGQPEQSGDAFAQGKVDENGTQRGERKNNLNYRKITWPLTFTPLKSGPQTIAFKIPVEITFPRQRGSTGGGGFFDEFFDRRDRRQFEVTTGEVALEIKSLPAQGRPDSFSGAIGQFTMQQSVSTQKLNAGDPISLRVTVSGYGNFERIQPIELAVDESWKAYDPSAEFTPTGSLEVEGSKVFEYVLIPQSPDITEAPIVRFAYFDPALQRYEEITPGPIKISVAPAPDIGSIAASTGSSPGENTAKSRRGNTLLPIMLLPGKWVVDTRPLFLSQRFLFIQCVPLIVILGITVVRKRQLRVREDDSFARHIRAGKSTRKCLQEARAAARDNDSEAFFHAAQRAIQESLGRHFHSRPETLIMPEIESFLQTREADDAIIAETKRIFEAADAVKFAGTVQADVPLPEQERSLQTLIGKLGALKR